MAKFNFRLKSYLDLKEKIEDQKKLEYGKALAKLEQERKVKEQLVQSRDYNVSMFKEKIKSEINPAQFRDFNNYIELLKKRIIEQEKVIKKEEENVESKRSELVEAVKQHKILDKLKEKSYAEYMREEQIAEQKRVDEIVSYQYNDKE